MAAPNDSAPSSVQAADFAWFRSGATAADCR
jgi:hypothetical protein